MKKTRRDRALDGLFFGARERDRAIWLVAALRPVADGADATAAFEEWRRRARIIDAAREYDAQIFQRPPSAGEIA